MTSSSDRPTITVLRGAATAGARPARLHADLRTSPYAGTGRFDPRLVDTGLERAVAEAAAVAEDAARTEGWAVGYQAGYDEGRRAAAEAATATASAVREEAEAALARQETLVAQALSALTRAADDLGQRTAPAADEVTALAARWAVEIADALVGHHIAVGDCAASDALDRVLAQTSQGRAVTVRLNPADAEALVALRTLPADVSIVADPGVARGDAVGEAGDRRIDARLESALARLREVLGA